MKPKPKSSKTSRASLDANTHPQKNSSIILPARKRGNRIKTAPKTEVALSKTRGRGAARDLGTFIREGSLQF